MSLSASFNAFVEMSQLPEDPELESNLHTPLLERANAVVFSPPVVELGAVPSPDSVASIDHSKRVQASKFALTYPKCDVLPSVALSKIVSHAKLAKIGFKHVVVVREKHKDGSNHLHCSVVLKKQLKYSDKRGKFWDFVTGGHGNYQRTRRVPAWLVYITKFDEDPKVFPDSFDVQAYISSNKKKQSYDKHEIASKIVSGQRSMSELISSHSAFLLMNGTKVESFIALCNARDAAQRPLVDLPRTPDIMWASEWSLAEQSIYAWLIECKHNIFSRGATHLRVLGSTGVGKTYLSCLVQKIFRVYSMPYAEHWLDEFDGSHNMIVFDEYKSQKTIQFLNSFCDGAGVPLSRRRMAPFVHSTYVPCLMLTNFTWDEAYSKAFNNNPKIKATLERRWTTVSVDEPTDIISLCKYLEHLCTL